MRALNGLQQPLLSPRWKKVLGDLWSNRSRTLLVILSIFVGVFAVGVLGGAQTVLQQHIRTSYQQTNPAHASISVSEEDSFNDSLIYSVEDIEGVADAEARGAISAQVLVAPEQWQSIQFTAIPDYAAMSINQIRQLEGAWPPPDKAVLIERSSMDALGVAVGDSILVERPDGDQRQVRVAGVVQDLSQIPSGISNTIYGYITFETLEWLGGSRDYTQLVLRFSGDTDNHEYNRETATAVYEQFLKSGRTPAFPSVPPPDDHWSNQLLTGIATLLSILGGLSIILGGFLVTNTIAALLAQQTKQIGIMKTVGARLHQMVGMYIGMVLCFGVLALLLALPTTYLAVSGLVGLVAGLLNFDAPANIRLPTGIMLVQALVSLLVPVVAALVPVWLGTRITVREALSSDSGSGYGQGLLDRLLRRVRGLPRPLLLALRNTFRRKGRVALTLVTLSLGGAIFMGIFSVRSSLVQTLDDLIDALFGFDLQVSLEKEHPTDYLAAEALRVPGVVAAESWSFASTRRVLPDDSEGQSLTLRGVPPETDMMQPQLQAGRWLRPADENALVVSTSIMDSNPDLAVGDEIVLTIEGRESTWRIVGVMVVLQGTREVYAPFSYLGQVTRDADRSAMVVVKTEQSTPAFVDAVSTRLEEHFERNAINVTNTFQINQARESNELFFNIIIYTLMVMALLIAMVGGLGLAGTMSLNVIERVREIGIMRAIGASNGTVLQIILSEGLLLGLMSWLIAALLALPMGALLSNVVGVVLLQTALSFSFSPGGLLIWLGIVLGLATIASILPARNAARLTVRDVLAHE
jgi:putative ABC transport system permease protein